MMDVEAVKKQALKEMEEEDYRAAVDLYKERLRRKKSFLDIVFPYKIILIRKER